MSLHVHHRRALAVIGTAAALDVILGIAFAAVTPGMPAWHGLFCALANAVTDGGDAPPVNMAGYAVTAVEYLTVVPLFAGAFSLFTSGLAAARTEQSEDRIKQHVEDRFAEHRQPGIVPKLDHLGAMVDNLAAAVRDVMAARAQRDEPAPATAEAVEHLGEKVDLVIRAVTPSAVSASAAHGPSPAAGGGKPGEGPAPRRPTRRTKGDKP